MKGCVFVQGLTPGSEGKAKFPGGRIDGRMACSLNHRHVPFMSFEQENQVGQRRKFSGNLR
jgi:hypothetical protein